MNGREFIKVTSVDIVSAVGKSRKPVHVPVLALCAVLLAANGFAVAAAVPDTAVSREKVLFDTDIGGDVDDALALAYLVCEPRCELLGVTTEGGRVDKRAEIASAVCTALGRADIPVHPGCSRSIWRGHRFDAATLLYWAAVTNRPHAAFIRTNSAVDFLRRTIRENPGRVTLIATGHFTNLGVLFALDPEIPTLLKRLVLMGGNLDGRAEWNAMCDPVATAVAFGNGNCGRAPETVVFPGNVTGRHKMTSDQGREFMGRFASLDLCAQAAEFWYRDGLDELYFHDPMAVVGVFHPEIASYTNAAVSVDVADRGITRYASDPSRTLKIVTKVDFRSFTNVLSQVLSGEDRGRAVARPVLRPSDRMVILGDSLTNQGLAVNAGDQIGYFHRLTNALARVHGPDYVTVVPLGYSGWHVPSWIETERKTRTEGFRFDTAGQQWDAKEVLDGGAEVAVFFLGMNDLLKPMFDDTPESLSAWKEKYRSLVRTVKARLKARDIALATATPLTCDLQSRKNAVRAKMNAAIRDLAKEEGARLIETGPALEELCAETCWTWRGCAIGDKIHPNWRAGHAALALAFARGLGEKAAADILKGEYEGTLKTQRAKFGALELVQTAVLPMDPDAESFDYRIDWLFGAGDVARVEPVLPKGWSCVRSERLAADRGRIVVRGRPDVKATKITVRATDGRGRTSTQEVTIPPPWRVSFNGGADMLTSSSWHYRGWGQAGEIDPFQVFHGTTNDTMTASRQYVSGKARPVDLVFSTRDYSKRLDLDVRFNGRDLGRVLLTPNEKQVVRRVEFSAGTNELVFTARLLPNQRQIVCDVVGVGGDKLDDVQYRWERKKDR